MEQSKRRREVDKRTDKQILPGRSPGLVVMGEDSCSKGREFEPWHRILDRQFFTFYLWLKLYCVFEKTK